MRYFQSVPPGLALIATYIVMAILLLPLAIAVSWVVTAFSEAVGLLVFLAFFLGSLYVAWPIAVWVFDRSRLEARLQERA